MKSLLKTSNKLLALTAVFTLAIIFLFSNDASANTYREGDILITSSSSSWGLTGHAGIVARSADGSLYAVHIGGYNQRVEKITLSQWNSKYPKTEVWRHSNSTAARQAGQKAMDFVRYYGSDKTYVAEYSLASKAALTKTDKSKQYCSKLVWQSYYYGPGYNLGISPDGMGIITPYSLRNRPNMSKAFGSL